MTAVGDPVLTAFLDADPREVDLHFETLVSGEVVDTVRRIVRQRLLGQGFRHTPEEVEDVQADAVSEIVARVRDLRDGFDAEPIHNFAAYVAVTAYNACHRFIRSRSPSRARLKNRLRYLFSHDKTLALWQAPSGDWLCARAERQGIAPTSQTAERLRALATDAGVLREATSSGRPNEGELARLLVKHIATGVDLDDLAGVTAEVLGLNDREPTHGASDGVSVVDRLETPGPSALTTIMDRQQLRNLWQHILDLPVRQRVALLLNLRDAEGRGVLALMPLTETATLREIATALDMPPRELAQIWNQLPVEDAVIAERLGLTRQQVINLRKSARERLWRRTAKSEEDGNIRRPPPSFPSGGVQLNAQQGQFRG